MWPAITGQLYFNVLYSNRHICILLYCLTLLSYSLTSTFFSSSSVSCFFFLHIFFPLLLPPGLFSPSLFSAPFLIFHLFYNIIIFPCFSSFSTYLLYFSFPLSHLSFPPLHFSYLLSLPLTLLFPNTLLSSHYLICPSLLSISLI